MTLLNIRDRIRVLLDENGLETTGCGYYISEKVADIIFKAGENRYLLVLTRLDPVDEN